MRVPSGTKGALATKQGSVVPEGTLDFFVIVIDPAFKTLGYCHKEDAKDV
jgi:hypothetical protein